MYLQFLKEVSGVHKQKKNGISFLKVKKASIHIVQNIVESFAVVLAKSYLEDNCCCRMNARYTHASLFDFSARQDNSERSINNIIWAPIFDDLFCNSIVKIKR